MWSSTRFSFVCNSVQTSYLTICFMAFCFELRLGSRNLNLISSIQFRLFMPRPLHGSSLISIWCWNCSCTVLRLSRALFALLVLKAYATRSVWEYTALQLIFLLVLLGDLFSQARLLNTGLCFCRLALHYFVNSWFGNARSREISNGQIKYFIFSFCQLIKQLPP